MEYSNETLHWTVLHQSLYGTVLHQRLLENIVYQILHRTVLHKRLHGIVLHSRLHIDYSTSEASWDCCCFFVFSRQGFSVALYAVLELDLVDQAGLKLKKILLPLPPEGWD